MSKWVCDELILSNNTCILSTLLCPCLWLRSSYKSLHSLSPAYLGPSVDSHCTVVLLTSGVRFYKHPCQLLWFYSYQLITHPRRLDVNNPDTLLECLLAELIGKKVILVCSREIGINRTADVKWLDEVSFSVSASGRAAHGRFVYSLSRASFNPILLRA